MTNDSRARSSSDVWSYAGKRVVIAGCHSGMGEATARELVRLGAEVHGVDIKPSPVDLASFHQVDLRHTAQIDAALDAIGAPIDASFYCAGLPQTFPVVEVMTVNFVHMRHWTEQVAARMPRGGACAMIASTAGHAWRENRPLIDELLATPDAAAGVAWCEKNQDRYGDAYVFSKMCIQVFCMKMATPLIKRGIRINVVNPAPTETPMMRVFESAAPAAFIDVFVEPIGRRAQPEEMAYPLIFLNSDAARFISGHNLNVDGGWAGSFDSGVLDPGALIEKALAAMS
jgi:NAD(P)-dependent dehydrogenase (short-subunit alcohol dehydrogenase family)